MNSLLQALGLTALLIVSPIALGQAMTDPTAPPAILAALQDEQPEAGEINAEAAAEPAESAEAVKQAPKADAAPPPGPSLVVSEPVAGGWRARALVGGELVGPGDTVALGEVIAINRRGLVITSGEGQRNEPVVSHRVIKHRPGDWAEDQ